MQIFDRCMYLVTSETTSGTSSVGRLQSWLMRRGLRQQLSTKDCGCVGPLVVSVKASGSVDTMPDAQTQS
jgi:hypothetical protein